MWNQSWVQGIYYFICGLALIIAILKWICASRRINDSQDVVGKNDYNSEERAQRIQESVIVKVRNSNINIFNVSIWSNIKPSLSNIFYDKMK